jgi:phosphohistidine phosphatase
MTTRLFLVQHGEAKPDSEDPDRPLTDTGAANVRRVAAATAHLVTVGRVVHSGKTRARQTADIWAETLGVAVEASDGLAPGDDPTIWADRIGDDDVMLVGHLPHLARLAGLLVAGDAACPVVAFVNGGLVGLRLAEGRWSVELVVPAAATLT